MQSNGRDRLRAALAHQAPERVPFAWGFGLTAEMERTFGQYLAERGLDWPRLRQAVTDTCTVAPEYSGPAPPGGDTFTGIWGIKLKTVAYGAGHYEEFTDFPLAGCRDPARLADYPWPDAANYDYDGLRSNALAARASGNALQLMAGNPFEIYCWLTGLEEALVNTALQPELVAAGLEFIGAFMVERLRRSLERIGDLVDIVFMADDLGSQQGLLLSRTTYRGLIQPVHRQLAATVRELAPDAFVMHHSDGAVFEILPDLIAAGVQVLEAVQTDAADMDPARLKATYGDRLAFHGAISVQHLLPHGDADTVTAECRRLVDILGAGGGYVAAPSHAIQAGTPPENLLAMLRAVLGDADYQRALAAAARDSITTG